MYKYKLKERDEGANRKISRVPCAHTTPNPTLDTKNIHGVRCSQHDIVHPQKECDSVVAKWLKRLTIIGLITTR